MTLGTAHTAAEVRAKQDRVAVGIWKHVGGATPFGNILPQGRYVVAPATQPPRWDVWTLVETVAAPKRRKAKARAVKRPRKVKRGVRN